MKDKSIVVEWPKGIITRVMPGSYGFELYQMGKMSPAFKLHMEELHKKFMKEKGK